MPRAVWLVTRVVAVISLTVWLFADTVRHLTSQDRQPAHVIRFAHFGSDQDYRLWQQVIEQFERRHPRVRVKHEYVAGWYGRYDTKLRQQLLAGIPPDVALVQSGPFASVARHFVNLDVAPTGGDPLPLDSLDVTGRALYRFDGAQRALPVWGGTLLIYCNLDCLERAVAFHHRRIPPPRSDWTMDDFLALARDLTCDFDGDGRIDQFGFRCPRWIYYLPFLWSHGARVVDPVNHRWALDGDAARRAFDFYQELNVGAHRVCPQPEEVSQVIQDVGFVTGRTAMCVSGPWMRPFLQEAGRTGRYTVANIPAGIGGSITRVTWDGIAIAADRAPRRLLNAWRFARFVVSPAAQRILTSRGRALPALASRRDQVGDAPGQPLFIASLRSARTQPRLPGFKSVDRAINRHLAQLVRPDHPITVEQFLSRLAHDPVIVPLVDAHRPHTASMPDARQP